MKKKLALILCVVMALTMLCGCDGDAKVKPEKAQQLYEEMNIQPIDEMNTELTLLENIWYSEQTYDEEYDQEYMSGKEEAYTMNYAIDTDEETCNEIAENYVDYLYAEGYECLTDIDGMSGIFVFLGNGEYVINVASVGEMQWEGYEGQCGITIIVYK